jgi:hypothetical protein
VLVRCWGSMRDKRELGQSIMIEVQMVLEKAISLTRSRQVVHVAILGTD